MQCVWEHSKQSGGALVLLLAIADNAHDDGDGAYPSIDTLARKARMTPRNVNMLLNKLAEAGEVVIRHGAGPHRCNVYKVCLPGVGDPEKISPRNLFRVKNPVSDPEISGNDPEAGFPPTLKPASPKPSFNRHSLNHQEEPSGERAVRAPRAAPIPDVFPVSEEMREWAREKVPALNLDHVHESFCEYWRGAGKPKVNWVSAWKHWMLKEVESLPAARRPRSPDPNRRRGVDDFVDMLRATGKG